MNYCTVIESTQCQVSLATATTAVTPESSAGYSAPAVESTIQAASATPVVEGTIVPGEPAPTTAATEVIPDAPQPTGETAASVISTTDSLGNPTLKTSSILAATGSVVTTGGTLSASSSATGKQQINSTAASSNGSPSGSMTAPSAPDRTNAGAVLKTLPSVALGTAAMVLAYFI